MQVQNKTQTLRKSYTFLSKACTRGEHIKINNNNNNNNNNNKQTNKQIKIYTNKQTSVKRRKEKKHTKI